jgi:hypothetical protein
VAGAEVNGSKLPKLSAPHNTLIVVFRVRSRFGVNLFVQTYNDRGRRSTKIVRMIELIAERRIGEVHGAGGGARWGEAVPTYDCVNEM